MTRLPRLPILAAILATLPLTACDWRPDRLIRTEQWQVEITHINPPKHFGLTFRRTDNGQEFTSSVAKHCNRWRSTAHVGDVHTISVGIYEHYNGRDRPTSETYQADRSELNRRFC